MSQLSAPNSFYLISWLWDFSKTGGAAGKYNAPFSIPANYIVVVDQLDIQDAIVPISNGTWGAGCNGDGDLITQDTPTNIGNNPGLNASGISPVKTVAVVIPYVTIGLSGVSQGRARINLKVYPSL